MGRREGGAPRADARGGTVGGREVRRDARSPTRRAHRSAPQAPRQAVHPPRGEGSVECTPRERLAGPPCCVPVVVAGPARSTRSWAGFRVRSARHGKGTGAAACSAGPGPARADAAPDAGAPRLECTHKTAGRCACVRACVRAHARACVWAWWGVAGPAVSQQHVAPGAPGRQARPLQPLAPHKLVGPRLRHRARLLLRGPLPPAPRTRGAAGCQ